MAARFGFILVVLSAGVHRVSADDTLYRYEANVSPCDKSAGWTCGNPCEEPCSDSIENGRYVLRWKRPAERVGYHLWIATPSVSAPSSLWVEWRFRSNHPIGPNFIACDGSFVVRHDQILEVVHMYGDTAISNSGDDFVTGLDLAEFHTYRFETTDGASYDIAVDGRVFIEDIDSGSDGYSYLQLNGRGSCENFLNTINEWDFVRYGTIATGEQIIAADPPAGFVAPQIYPGLDRFTVTFDAPNYVYIEDVSVSVSGGIRPNVIQTRRRENTEPDTVEIVLDRPLPVGQTTRFTFNGQQAGSASGTAVSVVEYIYSPPPGDTNGDGRVDLREMGQFQNCFGTSALSGVCKTLDLAPDDTIDISDLPPLISQLSGP